jgi:hypothetical protein
MARGRNFSQILTPFSLNQRIVWYSVGYPPTWWEEKTWTRNAKKRSRSTPRSCKRRVCEMFDEWNKMRKANDPRAKEFLEEVKDLG